MLYFPYGAAACRGWHSRVQWQKTVCVGDKQACNDSVSNLHCCLYFSHKAKKEAAYREEGRRSSGTLSTCTAAHVEMLFKWENITSSVAFRKGAKSWIQATLIELGTLLSKKITTRTAKLEKLSSST